MARAYMMMACGARAMWSSISLVNAVARSATAFVSAMPRVCKYVRCTSEIGTALAVCVDRTSAGMTSMCGVTTVRAVSASSNVRSVAVAFAPCASAAMRIVLVMVSVAESSRTVYMVHALTVCGAMWCCVMSSV